MTAPTLKVRIQRRPTLKLKVLPKFPSSVTAESPITLDRTGGNYEFGIDIDALQESITGFVGPGNAGQAAYYATTGSEVSGSSVLTINAGISGSATPLRTNYVNFYPVNTDNGVSIGYGTGAGNGEGGSITFYTKNPLGAAPGAHQELGFLQAYWYTGNATSGYNGYNFGGSLAIVLATTEVQTPTANGAGFIFQGITRGETAHRAEVSIAEGLTAQAPGATSIVTGQGVGTINGESGIYDGGKRVISASNTLLTKNQNATTQIQVQNSTNGTAAAAEFQATSDVASLEIGAAATLNSFALIAGRSYVYANSLLVVGSSGSNGTIIAVNGAEAARFNGLTPGQLTLGLVGTTVGKLALANATSGSVVVTTPAGALGTSVATMPVGTYNVVGDSLTQTLTNKTITTPSIAFGTGSASNILAVSTNTGFANGFQVQNNGTVSNASTSAVSYTVLSAGTNTYLASSVVGGASPAASLVSGAGMTGGLLIQANAGPLSIVAPTFSGTTTFSSGFTLGGTVAGGGNQLNNVIIGTSTPLAGTFTTATANAFVPNSSSVPTNGIYLPAANTLGWAVNSAAEVQLTSTALSPAVDGGNSLGTTALGWQNMFGATGFVLNVANGNWVATHTSGILTVGTGDLRVTTAGTNSASAVTVGGTQTLTSKTLTTPVINGTITGTTVFPLANGGTNANLTAVNGGVLYSTASAGAISAAGTTGQVFSSNGAAAPTWISQKSMWSCNSATTGVAAGQTRFIGMSISDAAESNSYFNVPYAGTFKNLYVSTSGAPGVGKNYVCTFRVNGADTNITGTISGNASNTTNDTTHTASITAGQTFSLKFVADAGAATATQIIWCIELDTP